MPVWCQMVCNSTHKCYNLVWCPWKSIYDSYPKTACVNFKAEINLTSCNYIFFVSTLWDLFLLIKAYFLQRSFVQPHGSAVSNALVQWPSAAQSTITIAAWDQGVQYIHNSLCLNNQTVSGRKDLVLVNIWSIGNCATCPCLPEYNLWAANISQQLLLLK